MASYPFLVQTAWYTLESVVKQWKDDPDRWLAERDLQLEIASRLNTVYKLLGMDTVSSSQSGKVWSRVACEPYVSYTYTDNKQYRCHPDIIVWDDWRNEQDPDYSSGKNWPILWACELKYKIKNPGTWDQEKLRYLVAQDHVKYACWVSISNARGTAASKSDWGRDQFHGRHLWHYDVSLSAT